MRTQSRVFVALWPPPEVRAQLDTLARTVGREAHRARPVAETNLHLTLAFIGMLQEPRVREVALRMRHCGGQPFEWSIDQVGFFAGARVVWAGGPDNAGLRRLVGCVRSELDALGVPFDSKPFVPHVTLLRDVSGPRPEERRIEPAISWRCDHPVLVRSEPAAGGVQYQPVDAFEP